MFRSQIHYFNFNKFYLEKHAYSFCAQKNLTMVLFEKFINFFKFRLKRIKYISDNFDDVMKNAANSVTKIIILL